MSNGNGIVSTAAGAALLVAAGVCGLAATVYAVVVAYVAGSEAQASIDGCTPADPMSLARASMEQLAMATGASPSNADVINVDETDVSVY